MQYLNGPQYAGLPQDVYGPNGFVQSATNPYGYMTANQQPQQQQYQQPIGRPPIDPRQFETPEITMGDSYKPMFSIVETSGGNVIPVDNAPSDAEVAEKKKRGRKKKTPTEVEQSSAIIPPSEGNVLASRNEAEHVDGVVDSTIYTYGETNALLHETLGQIDAINIELVQEFNNVRHNRTMKNKYSVLNNLSENIGSMISNRISTIKEINNCITKSNDMDYKKYKDIQASQSAMNDDKYIADLYQAFISQPANMAPQYQLPQIESSIIDSGIVRANLNQNDIISGSNNGNNMIDAGYMSYVANLTPEQNAMRYESNPNVEQCVIFDASTGAKYFQYMDVVTGEAIPNMPTYDQMFMEDMTLDVDKGIAKNINLNQTFRLITLNNDVSQQY